MKSRLFETVCLCLLVASIGVQAVPLATGYTIEITGFTDAEHTRSDGYRSSTDQNINKDGQVAGYSSRFVGTETATDRSARLYYGSSTINIGLIDADHTRTDGYRNSYAIYINEAGQVAGRSLRYVGTENTLDVGSSAWLYDGTSTINIGLVDAEHTNSDGFQYNSSIGLNEAGQVVGRADRFVGNRDDYEYGWSIWLYNGTSTITVSPTDPEHTRNDGYRSSNWIGFINEAGQVAGTSERYSGADHWGWTAWLYNGMNTINIGPIDAEHTRSSDGYRFNQSISINDAGQVVGRAGRYNGTGVVDHNGQSIWLYNGTSTINIGLTDAEHTRSDGYRYSDSESSSSATARINGAGQVVGWATRYNGSGADLGSSAWLYNGTSTINIGLTDAEHTRSDGVRSVTGETPFFSDINESGQVIGESTRYKGTDEWGQSIWLFDGTSTINIGLTDAEHTRSDGYRYSHAIHINEAGQVAGYSTRYNGTETSLGGTAWLYDKTLDQTFALVLSVRSDGYSHSSISYLGDDGLVLGTYRLYDTDDTSLGDRAFAFTIQDGAVDLGNLIDGGLNAAGWGSLKSAYDANDRGQIIGSGLLSDMPSGRMTYILTPVYSGLVDLGGTIKTGDGQDICAMVLASGQYMFSCNPSGEYSLLNLPREQEGTVKRQIYADGFFPKIDIFTDSIGDAVVMARSGTCPNYNNPSNPALRPGSAGKRIDISGKVLLQDSAIPICAMVLANGQYMFTCDGTGNYALNIPLDNNGQFKLQVYADGFAPITQKFDEFRPNNDVRMARAVECQ